MPSGFSGIFSPVMIAAASTPLPLSQVPIRLSILPAQMTREGELQAIRAVGAPAGRNIFLTGMRPSTQGGVLKAASAHPATDTLHFC